MKKIWNLSWICGLLAIGCEVYTGLQYLENVDINPPIFLSYFLDDALTLRINYDENIRVMQSETSITPSLEISSYEHDDKQIKIIFASPTTIGMKYTLQLFVKDDKGNSAGVVIPFYGYNDHIPRIVINEFIPEGSKTHPDIIELRVMAEGNMGGLTIYDGVPGTADESFTFPAHEVSEGDFILVHWKSSGNSEERDETDDIVASGGYDASATAWDYWVKEGNGISNTTGILTLTSRPYGDVLDAVAYTIKIYVADSSLRGFGRSSDLNQLQWLIDQNAWKIAGEEATPEDLIPSKDSTATRSINRSSQSTDTNHKSDWHIAPSRGFSLGEVNTDEEYIKN